MLGSEFGHLRPWELADFTLEELEELHRYAQRLADAAKKK